MMASCRSMPGIGKSGSRGTPIGGWRLVALARARESEAAEPIHERPARHAQALRRATLIAAARVQRLQDAFALQQRQLLMQPISRIWRRGALCGRSRDGWPRA